MLLVWWHNLHAPDEPYQVIEYFAGVGRIAAVAKYQGYKTAAVDLEYGKDIPRKKKRGNSRPPMDLNGSAGLMLLDKCLVNLLFLFYACWVYNTSCCLHYSGYTKNCCYMLYWFQYWVLPLLHVSGKFLSNCMCPLYVLESLRLAIHLLLCSDSVAAFYAVVCSSWVPVNRGSTLRDILTPLGNEDYPSVRRGNKLTARTVFF